MHHADRSYISLKCDCRGERGSHLIDIKHPGQCLIPVTTYKLVDSKPECLTPLPRIAKKERR